MPWIGNNELNALTRRIEELSKETSELREQVDEALTRRLEEFSNEASKLREQVDEARIASIVAKAIDPFFRYQNQKLDSFAAYFSSEDKIFRFSMDGVSLSFYLPMAASDRVQHDILRSSYFYQPKPLFFIQRQKLVNASSVVVDAGANIGNHTVFFGRVGNVSKIHAFEPNPPAFSILRRNVEINELQDIVDLHCTGLGAKASRARNLNARSNNLGGNQIADDDSGDVVVERLDDLNLPKVDFMKIDVEGRGDGVINGALETISRNKPKMLVEETSEGEKRAIDMLKSDFGYREVWRHKMDLILAA
ncbi:FkbM family methyltransferase [Sinorhizobium meliloti]|uniref:FkbM family methyltransferase n=1 Tax=Rhizobium meliloti TaxID=382 RepID=UPI001297E708|nr:FkbM family methyltransferase [Sinorhizobium meliloti]MDE3801381.1 FkbM family methyltransferase [Sinorhizobium meliloti]MDW9428081.1 FkbM family methyltransferase [Sinorhizobium meliloti]MDW9974052.1 FkbM family methyltransferase [Sinorhizobium meliloti]MDW9975126.1 FkbM family methyltransferase [Sinorhizobium meliloti]MDX0018174.1 FkbM family methyltransferase [Sinorhizobium meliloti]